MNSRPRFEAHSSQRKKTMQSVSSKLDAKKVSGQTDKTLLSTQEDIHYRLSLQKAQHHKDAESASVDEKFSPVLQNVEYNLSNQHLRRRRRQANPQYEKYENPSEGTSATLQLERVNNLQNEQVMNVVGSEETSFRKQISNDAQTKKKHWQSVPHLGDISQKEPQHDTQIENQQDLERESHATESHLYSKFKQLMAETQPISQQLGSNPKYLFVDGSFGVPKQNPDQEIQFVLTNQSLIKPVILDPYMVYGLQQNLSSQAAHTRQHEQLPATSTLSMQITESVYASNQTAIVHNASKSEEEEETNSDTKKGILKTQQTNRSHESRKSVHFEDSQMPIITPTFVNKPDMTMNPVKKPAVEQKYAALGFPRRTPSPVIEMQTKLSNKKGRKPSLQLTNASKLKQPTPITKPIEVSLDKKRQSSKSSQSSQYTLSSKKQGLKKSRSLTQKLTIKQFLEQRSQEILANQNMNQIQPLNIRGQNHTRQETQ